MDALRMVPVAVRLPLVEAQVVAAHLGAEGILCQLRGATSVYPVGVVDLLVPVGELDDARAVLGLAAEADPVDEPPAGAMAWVGLALVGLVLASVLARILVGAL